MTKVPIILPDELRRFVDRSVESGSYHNVSEVVANALHALKAQEGYEMGKLAALRRDINIGLHEADKGEFSEFNADGIKEQGRGRLSGDLKK